MKGAQHKDPTTLAPIEGEASPFPFLFFFYLPGRERKGEQGEKRTKGKGEKSIWVVVSGE